MTVTFARSKIFLTEKLTNGTLVTPTPVLPFNHWDDEISHTQLLNVNLTFQLISWNCPENLPFGNKSDSWQIPQCNRSRYSILHWNQTYSLHVWLLWRILTLKHVSNLMKLLFFFSVCFKCVFQLYSSGSQYSYSHYLNQYWNIAKWAPRNKTQWNLNRDSYILFKKNAYENVVGQMTAILSRGRWVNW